METRKDGFLHVKGHRPSPLAVIYPGAYTGWDPRELAPPRMSDQEPGSINSRNPPLSERDFSLLCQSWRPGIGCKHTGMGPTHPLKAPFRVLPSLDSSSPSHEKKVYIELGFSNPTMDLEGEGLYGQVSLHTSGICLLHGVWLVEGCTVHDQGEGPTQQVILEGLYHPFYCQGFFLNDRVFFLPWEKLSGSNRGWGVPPHSLFGTTLPPSPLLEALIWNINSFEKSGLYRTSSWHRQAFNMRSNWAHSLVHCNFIYS